MVWWTVSTGHQCPLDFAIILQNQKAFKSILKVTSAVVKTWFLTLFFKMPSRPVKIFTENQCHAVWINDMNQNRFIWHWFSVKMSRKKFIDFLSHLWLKFWMVAWPCLVGYFFDFWEIRWHSSCYSMLYGLTIEKCASYDQLRMSQNWLSISINNYL